MSEAFMSPRRCRRPAPRAALALSLMTWATVSTAADIHVPADQPTIQDGINVAVDGDRVVVSPGTYYEQINFQGKSIAVVSTDGAGSTIIDGKNRGPVVSINAREQGALLQGFTITHGSDPNGGGGGMTIGSRATPTIQDNDFESNSAEMGGAIFVDDASPRIQGNQFRHNNCTYLGGAILVYRSRGTHGTLIEGNLFEFNGGKTCTGGGAVYVWDSKPVVIKRNVIRNNVSGNLGGGLGVEHGRALIANNLIHDNRAEIRGGGVILFVGYANNSADFINNTLAGNIGDDLYVVTAPSGVLNAANNVFLTSHGKTSIQCELGKRGGAAFSHNLVFSTSGAQIEGNCDVAGGGLLTVDPMFVGGDDGHNRHAYWLAPGSPAIDAGDDAAVRQRRDLTGAKRIQGAAVDLGAIEFRVD